MIGALIQHSEIWRCVSERALAGASQGMANAASCVTAAEIRAKSIDGPAGLSANHALCSFLQPLLKTQQGQMWRSPWLLIAIWWPFSGGSLSCAKFGPASASGSSRKTGFG